MRRGFAVIQPVAVTLTARSSRALFQCHVRDVTGLSAAPLALEGSQPADSVAENTDWALQSAPVWPLTYSETTGDDPQLLTVAVSFPLGTALVLMLSRLASQQPEARKPDPVVES